MTYKKNEQMEEMIDHPMVMLVAPDGSVQPGTMAEDLPQCLAFLKLLHSKGLGESPSKLLFKGFKIMPVKVTILQNGDEAKAFNSAKNKN